MRNLGKTILKLRKAKNFTQTELASESKVSRDYIAQLETGDDKENRKTPSQEILAKIAAAFEIDASVLILMSMGLDEVNEQVKGDKELFKEVEQIIQSVEKITFLLLKKGKNLKSSSKSNPTTEDKISTQKGASAESKEKPIPKGKTNA